MENNLLSVCPRCNSNLIVTRLSCTSCDLEVNGDFHLSKFDHLTPVELEFIECFLKHQGNFKAVQNERGLSYPAAKKKLLDILIKLNLASKETTKGSEDHMPMVTSLYIKENDSAVIKTIKEKLNSTGGRATITLYSGDSCEIWFEEDGGGLVSPKAPTNQLLWEVFDAAVEVVIKNGGRAKKGNAQSGARLGTEKLPLNSVEGYIAHKVHGAKEGETAFGPGFVICAILDWADICKNERGYLSINPNFKSVLDHNKGEAKWRITKSFSII